MTGFKKYIKLIKKNKLAVEENKLLVGEFPVEERSCINVIRKNMNNLYVALGNKLYNFSNGKCVATHEKKINAVDSFNEVLCCASFDGTATLLLNEKFLDTIEGPDTEIKSVCLTEEFLIMGTRGKTVWILQYDSSNKFNYEIKNILSDHTQDVKGVSFFHELLCSWSYDKSVKIYLQNSGQFELLQSLSCGETVWQVLTVKDFLIATLQSGCIEVFQRKNGFFEFHSNHKFSVTPITKACKLSEELFVIVCNYKVLVFINSALEVVGEYEIDEKISAIEVDEEKIYVGTEVGSFYVLELTTSPTN